MSNYTSKKILLPDSLDEIGLMYSMTRNENETLSEFRHRIILEQRRRIDNNIYQLQYSFGRELSEKEKPQFIIEPMEDARRCRVLVTAAKVSLWSDYNESPVAEMNTDGYAVKIIDILYLLGMNGFSLLEANSYEPDGDARNLCLYDSKKQGTESLLNSKMNRLGKRFIQEITFSDTTIFQNEKETKDDVLADGDYYVDYIEGIVFSFNNANGFASYIYFDNNAVIYASKVKCYTLNDESIDNIIKTNDRINPKGIRYYQESINRYPFVWGK